MQTNRVREFGTNPSFCNEYLCPRSFCKKEGTTAAVEQVAGARRSSGMMVQVSGVVLEQRPSGELQKELATDGSSSGWQKYRSTSGYFRSSSRYS